jgi:hypothetical protein
MGNRFLITGQSGLPLLTGDMDIKDLWLEIVQRRGQAPSRSQFYEWLKASLVIEPHVRGGCRQPRRFTERDRVKLLRFCEFLSEHRTLQAAQMALVQDIETNSHYYPEA